MELQQDRMRTKMCSLKIFLQYEAENEQNLGAFCSERGEEGKNWLERLNKTNDIKTSVQLSLCFT